MELKERLNTGDCQGVLSHQDCLVAVAVVDVKEVIANCPIKMLKEINYSRLAIINIVMGAIPRTMKVGEYTR